MFKYLLGALKRGVQSRYTNSGVFCLNVVLTHSVTEITQ